MSSFGNVRMGLDDDSPYAVFDQGNSAIDTNLENDEEFNRALTSHGRAKFGKTSSSTNCLSTAKRSEPTNYSRDRCELYKAKVGDEVKIDRFNNWGKLRIWDCLTTLSRHTDTL